MYGSRRWERLLSGKRTQVNMSASQPSPNVTRARRYRYKVYGLSVRSELELPELHDDERPGDADVDIRVGTVPFAGGEGLSLGPDGAVLRINGIATYLMRAGREIIVHSSPGAADRNVRLYLLGSAMGILLHQKGLLPLHANAIEIDGRAAAFMGETGAGKSTLAAWLHDAGHRVIADDVCVLRFDEERGRVGVQPGMPAHPTLERRAGAFGSRARRLPVLIRRRRNL